MDEHFDYLDELAQCLREGNRRVLARLSTSERLYVVMAANRTDLLRAEGVTLVQACFRLGQEWMDQLILRHLY